MEMIEVITREMRNVARTYLAGGNESRSTFEMLDSYADRIDAAFDSFCESKKSFYCTNTDCPIRKALSELIKKGGI